MASYEKIRQKRIEENKLKMEEYGLKKAVNAMSQLNKTSKKKISKMHSKPNSKNDNDEYTPTGNAELNSSEDENEPMMNTVQLRSRSKKVSNTSFIAMSDLVKMCHSNNKIRCLDNEPQTEVVAQTKHPSSSDQIKQKRMVSSEANLQQGIPLLQSGQNKGGSSISDQVRLGKSLTQRKLSLQRQQEKEADIQHNAQQRKVTIAPGSMSAYLKLKAKLREKELRAKQSDALVQKLCLQNQELQTAKYKRSSTTVIRSSDSQPLGHVSEEEYDNSMSLSECDLVVEREEGVDRSDGVHIGDQLEMEIDPVVDQDQEEPSRPKLKRTRGPTMCKDVHEWTFDQRKPIILNERGEPIGPDKETLDKFSSFLGTLSRNSTLAPLNKISWHYVLDKDNIWNYVKAESKKKQESSTNQIYRHTMGPKSFARKQYELQQQDAEKRPPSQACMYKETRKRKAGNEYKTPYEAIQSNIDKMDEVQLERKVDGDIAYCEVMESDMSKDKIQLRKCSIIKGQSKRVSVGGIIIPDEYLQPIKEQIMKDTVGEVIKMFKQQLHPETFANLSQTLGGLSCIPELETDQERDNAKNPSGEHVQDQDDEVE